MKALGESKRFVSESLAGGKKKKGASKDKRKRKNKFSRKNKKLLLVGSAFSMLKNEGASNPPEKRKTPSRTLQMEGKREGSGLPLRANVKGGL